MSSRFPVLSTWRGSLYFVVSMLLWIGPLSAALGQLRDSLSTIDIGPWSVVDPFPDSNFSQNGAMQLHQHPLRDDVFYVCSWKGTIIEVRRNGNSVQERTIVDVRDGDIRWLFGCALHPDFRGDGTGDERIYLHYTTELDNNQASPKYLRISEIQVPAAGAANSAHERILIQNQVDHREHVGGGLAFDDRGFLFVSIGDGGWHDDSRSTSQKINEGLFSGVFRLDVDQRGGAISHPPKRQPQSGATDGYFIPSDNPFVGQPGVLEEFWALGLRNPWRIYFDEQRGALWIGEVGQNHKEQIELARAGTNHEWSYKEGSLRFDHSYLNGEVPPVPIGRLTSPLYEYDHLDQNYAVVGGFVYSGNKFPELNGKYIFGDNQSSRVWALDPESGQAELILRLPSGRKRMALTSISGDRAGNVYFTSFAAINQANVLQLARSTPANMPERLSQTGIFADIASLTPADRFIAYDVNSPLWSDGMHKQRWLRLPEGERIDNASHENWRFPPGTMFVKHFQEPGGRHLETRALTVKPDGHVFGATYVWNDAQDDALLRVERSSQTVSGLDAMPFEYHMPSARDCVVCHNHEYPVLGVNGLQLSGNGAAAGTASDPLVAWSQLGLFERPIAASTAAGLLALASLEKPTASLEHRVRSYLHSNCSYCHHPTGTQRVVFDARITTPLAQARIIGDRGMTNYLSIDGRRADFIIAPGDPENSAIFRRMRTTERELSMPYLGRTIADDLALATVSEWISQLSGTAENQPSDSGSCDYTHAEVNSGWGWNATTGESCPPLGAGESDADSDNNTSAVDDNAYNTACDYSHADLNDGWGWDPDTQQSCPPRRSHESTEIGVCDYAHADQNDGWGWNETTGTSCRPR